MAGFRNTLLVYGITVLRVWDSKHLSAGGFVLPQQGPWSQYQASAPVRKMRSRLRLSERLSQRMVQPRGLLAAGVGNLWQRQEKHSLWAGNQHGEPFHVQRVLGSLGRDQT